MIIRKENDEFEVVGEVTLEEVQAEIEKIRQESAQRMFQQKYRCELNDLKLRKEVEKNE